LGVERYVLYDLTGALKNIPILFYYLTILS